MGVEELRRGGTHHQVLGNSVRAARPPVTVQWRARRHAAQRARPGHRRAAELFQRAHRPDHGDARQPRHHFPRRAARTAVRTRLILDERALDPSDGRFTTTRPALLGRTAGSESDAVTLVVTDPGLEGNLSGTEPPALRAAASSRRTRDPGRAAEPLPRGGVRRHRLGSFRRVRHRTARGAPSESVGRPVTVDTLLVETPTATVDDTPDGDHIIRTLAPVTVRKAPVKAGDYYQGLLDRNAIAALFGADDPRVVVGRPGPCSRWFRPTWRTRPADASRMPPSCTRSASPAAISLIHSPEHSITLTSSEANIPLHLPQRHRQEGPDPHRGHERQAVVPRRHRS